MPFKISKYRPALKNSFLPLLLTFLLMELFWPTFVWMNQRFFEENSYYRHGWLIPGAIAFLLWQRRKAIKNRPLRTFWPGFLLLLLGILIHLTAQFLQINFISGWAFLLTVLGMGLFHWGPARMKLATGPLLLMIFMIPLPGIWVIALTFRLKVISASLGVSLARCLGLEVWQNRMEIILPASPAGPILTIGDPCSGLRSLLSFGALGGFISIILPLPLWKKSVVFLTALALAPASNIIRVWSLIILRQTVGPQILGGSWHLILGLVIFSICLLVLLQVARWLLR